jgi:predicted SnoaL-like aldol condensation-catalyzing enzyme
MSTTEETRAALAKWYDEMWFVKDFDRVPECVGPTYTRHEAGGTRTITAEEYRDFLKAAMVDAEISVGRYRLIAEDDHVVAIGSWVFNGQQWDWVQAFRVEHGKLVETWLSGIGFDTMWGPDAIRP